MGCLVLDLGPGTRRTCDNPTRTPWRNSEINRSLTWAGIAWSPAARARLAWWISSRSASWIWVGQCASG